MSFLHVLVYNIYLYKLYMLGSPTLVQLLSNVHLVAFHLTKAHLTNVIKYLFDKKAERSNKSSLKIDQLKAFESQFSQLHRRLVNL